MLVDIYGNSHFLKTVALVKVSLWSMQRKWCYCGRVKQPKPVGLKLIRYDVMKHSDTCRSRARLQDGVLGTLGSPHWSAKASLPARACPKALTRSGASRITSTAPGHWTVKRRSLTLGLALGPRAGGQQQQGLAVLSELESTLRLSSSWDLALFHKKSVKGHCQHWLRQKHWARSLVRVRIRTAESWATELLSLSLKTAASTEQTVLYMRVYIENKVLPTLQSEIHCSLAPAKSFKGSMTC